jgi:hypothetical protein
MAMMTLDPEDFVSSLTPALRARVNELQVQLSNEEHNSNERSLQHRTLFCIAW